MGYLPDQLSQANLSNQQDVVAQRTASEPGDAPTALLKKAFFHQLFPKEHPYYAEISARMQTSRRPSSRTFEISSSSITHRTTRASRLWATLIRTMRGNSWKNILAR